MVIVGERGDTTGVLGLIQILVSCSCIVSQISENDSHHLWNLIKIAQKH
jgi:hypothetical protein